MTNDADRIRAAAGKIAEAQSLLCAAIYADEDKAMEVVRALHAAEHWARCEAHRQERPQ